MSNNKKSEDPLTVKNRHLLILGALTYGRKQWKEIWDETKIKQSTLNVDLKCLEDKKLIIHIGKGKSGYYILAKHAHLDDREYQRAIKHSKKLIPELQFIRDYFFNDVIKISEDIAITCEISLSEYHNSETEEDVQGDYIMATLAHLKSYPKISKPLAKNKDALEEVDEYLEKAQKIVTNQRYWDLQKKRVVNNLSDEEEKELAQLRTDFYKLKTQSIRSKLELGLLDMNEIYNVIGRIQNLILRIEDDFPIDGKCNICSTDTLEEIFGIEVEEPKKWTFPWQTNRT